MGMREFVQGVEAGVLQNSGGFFCFLVFWECVSPEHIPSCGAGFIPGLPG